MNNLIKLLKKNRYAFGMWPDPECYGEELGKAMQEKAREIGQNRFWKYLMSEDGEQCGFIDAKRDFDEYKSLVFCLHPDYKDEPGIREMEISGNMSNCLCMYNDEGQSFGSIAKVHERADFIGFKFADGSWYHAPIKPVGPDGKLWSGNITVHDIVSGRVTVLHATHVLSKQKKQE